VAAERYFTGKLCRRGHLSERWVRTKICIECSKWHTSQWYKAHSNAPGVAEGYRIRGKRWRDKDPEKERLRAADWRKREPEKATAASERWRKLNPDKRQAGLAKRRARKAGAGGSYSAADVAEILKMQRSKCGYCRCLLKGRDYHVDHITALSKGGTNYRSNIQILCKSCNISKGARDPLDFARQRGGLL
jgi:5-methylcytosine-specific restriction endonuclease McrA